MVPLAMGVRVENPGRHNMLRQFGQPRDVGWRSGARSVEEDVKGGGV